MNFKAHQNTFDDKLSAGIGLTIGLLLFIAGGFWVRNIVIREGRCNAKRNTGPGGGQHQSSRSQ
ncbi:MAG: hypothetical protein V7K55_02175 [Nostoc sp.]|uniref:hypothetical protein n=1 Tax=Nostoc sp. TaxID=1180 RepID=UPI002FFD29B7